MVNGDYKLPIFEYMTQERDIIPLEKSFYDLGEYTEEEIANTYEIYKQLYEEIHAISYNSLNTLLEKFSLIKVSISKYLGLYIKEINPTEIELIHIEQLISKRIEELHIVKTSKAFERSMAFILK